MFILVIELKHVPRSVSVYLGTLNDTFTLGLVMDHKHVPGGVCVILGTLNDVLNDAISPW